MCHSEPVLTLAWESPSNLRLYSPKDGDCHTSDVGHWFAMTGNSINSNLSARLALSTQFIVPSDRAKRADTRLRRALASGVSAVPEDSIHSMDACWACLRSPISKLRSATRKAGRPDCREPKKSPGPRRRRSSSAILKPSLVPHRAFSRWRVSGFRLWEVRMH